MSAVVRATGLFRWYGEVIGLNDVTIDIEPGITGLLGPNGAGKSSFLRILSGEIRPSMGTVEVLGERPFANPELHARIGYCPEGDRFFNELTARRFLIHLLRLRGYANREAGTLADGALDRVGMRSAAMTRLGACSRGMRQRIKLAQALAHDPEFLILDEPLSGLDPVARHDTQVMLRGLVAEGASVLISSHVLHEIEALTRRVLLIHRGRIAASGEVSEIRALMDRHPHRIRLTTPEPRRLGALLLARDDLRSIRFESAALTVETVDPESVYAALPRLVVSEGLDITGVESPDDHLEAVFEILVTGGPR